MMVSQKIREVNIICPICRANKSIPVPISIINQAKGLATISIPKNAICKHHFQAFIDKNFRVRGYQKVDYEFSHITKEREKKPSITPTTQTHVAPISPKKNEIDETKNLFKKVKIKENSIEYYPNAPTKSAPSISPSKEPSKTLSKKITNRGDKKVQDQRSLKEIYEDFWDLIDEDNELFQEFIKNDKRRKNLNRSL